MKYSINPAMLFSAFPVPCCVTDEHLRIATELQIKTLLCALRSLQEGIQPQLIADKLGVPLYDIEDALLFWKNNGTLISDAPENVESAIPAVQPIIRTPKPTRADVAERGLEDPKVRFLMQEAQQCFGRGLKSNEAGTLLWIYDDQGMDVSVILMLLQFAKKQDNLNIRFVERTALDWIKNGVKNVRDAETAIAYSVRKQSAWSVVEAVFGIERRQPSARELELSDKWINEWKLSRDMLKKSYDVCIDSKAKLSMPYIDKVLEKWHKDGIDMPQKLENSKKQQKSKSNNGFATYDLEAFERMLNSND